MKIKTNIMNHSPQYRFHRFANWFPLGLTYATFYMGRYNLNVTSKTIMDMFHLSKSDFGIIATCGFWTYALSVMFNGPLADKIGGKKSILIGAVGAAIINLVIGILFLNEWQTKIIIGMSLLYSVNQYFQSFGALSVVKVNSSWFHVKERGVFGGIFGIMISSGYLLAYTVGGWILSHFAWYWVFIVPSFAMLFMFIIDFLTVNDKPSNIIMDSFKFKLRTVIGFIEIALLLGLVGFYLSVFFSGFILDFYTWAIILGIILLVFFIRFLGNYQRSEKSPKDFEDFNTGDATSDDPDKDKPIDRSYLIKKILTNPVIITITIAEFCTGFVRQGLLLWLVPFLSEVHHIEHGSALYNIATLGITMGGIAGGLLCGFLSDKVFQSRRPPVAFIFYIGQIIFVLLLGWVSDAAIAAYLVGVCCMWIFGVHGMLSGTASMDFGGTKAAGTVTGMLDGVQYVASGLTGFLLGAGLDKWGWGSWTYMIVPFSVIGAVMMLRIWNATPKTKHS